MTRSEDWSKIICDQCQTVNWIYLGDPLDETVPDVLGLLCRECGKAHYFSDEIELEMGIGCDHDSFDIGLDNPNE